jgi:hypothetical protein
VTRAATEELFRAGRRHPGLDGRFVFLTGDTLSPETRKFLFLEPRGIPSVTKPFALPEVRLAVERALRAG